LNKRLKQQVNLILDGSIGSEVMSFHTEDHREAATAFVGKRRPKFHGK